MRSIQLDEFKHYRFLSALQYAPGGQAAAFVVSQADMEENAYESSIYLYEKGEVKRLTGLGKEAGFVWLDENRLIFTAVRSAAEKKRAEAKDVFTSYYVIDIRGGEADNVICRECTAQAAVPAASAAALFGASRGMRFKPGPVRTARSSRRWTCPPPSSRRR